MTRWLTILAALLVLTAAACGKKGDLTRPEGAHPKAEKMPERYQEELMRY